MVDETSRLVGIDKVVDEEIKIITKRRKRLYPNRESTGCTRTNLIGLALSGGGIRSAVTNLGVLYEMSRVGLFNVVDYLSTVSGGGYIGGCIASLLSLKKPGTEQPVTKDLYTFYTHDDGKSDSSLFSTSWNSFPFRDLPLNEKNLPQDETRPDNTLSGYGDDSLFCKEFSSRDQVFHLRNRASYLIPSSLPFGSYVIRALGAVSAPTLLSLLWFFSLIVMLTTVYTFITFSGWNTGEATIHSPATVAAYQYQQTDNNSDSVMLKKADDGLINTIMNKASLALSNVTKRLYGQIEVFSTFAPDKWLALLFGIIWGFFAPSCMHWRGKIYNIKDIIGENLESYISRKQLKCISLTTIGLLFAVLFIGIFYRQIPSSHPDPRLLLPAAFSVGCLIGSLIVLCLLATDLRDPSPTNSKGGDGRREQRKIPEYLSWNRISRSEVALCTGIFIYCLIGSCIFAILPAFIMSGNSGFIALTLAILILVMRFYFSEEKKKQRHKRKADSKSF